MQNEMKLKQLKCIKSHGDELDGGGFWYEEGDIWEECPFSQINIDMGTMSIYADASDSFFRSVKNAMACNKLLFTMSFEMIKTRFEFHKTINIKDSVIYFLYIEKYNELKILADEEKERILKRLELLNRLSIFEQL
jgi:hypothetical protein